VRICLWLFNGFIVDGLLVGAKFLMLTIAAIADDAKATEVGAHRGNRHLVCRSRDGMLVRDSLETISWRRISCCRRRRSNCARASGSGSGHARSAARDLSWPRNIRQHRDSIAACSRAGPTWIGHRQGGREPTRPVCIPPTLLDRFVLERCRSSVSRR
jgi:hypothetical protein